MVEWTNPHGVQTSQGFLYFIRVTDLASGHEYRYIGKATSGESRLRAYRGNVERIFAGLPRRITPGQEKYRGVHLALAKAVQNGWNYEFYPLENADAGVLNQVEQARIRQLRCNLNSARAWSVADYSRLSLDDVCG